MSKKTIKPKRSERNRVIWEDKDFIRKHSLSYPKPMWLTRHTKSAIVLLCVVFVTIFISLIFKVLRIPSICVWLIMATFLLVDNCIAVRRTDKFCRELLRRKGEIITPYNYRLIKGNSVNFIFSVFFIIFICTFVGIALYFEINKQNSSDFNGFFGIFSLYYSSIFTNSPIFGPFIFMDTDEGMFFGGALFSYDILSGITLTGEGNKFVLHYEGKTVAYGNMLSDDMKFLKEILDIRKKYKE